MPPVGRSSLGMNMGYRWGPEPAVRACARRALARAARRFGGRWVAAGLALAVLAAAPAPADDAAILSRHAVVINSNVIGSAFLLEDGLAVTNRHVVRGLHPGGRVVLLAADGGQAEGRLIGASRRMDVAALAVPKGFMPVVAGTDARVAAGLAVSAAGIDAGAGGTGRRLAVAGVVVDPSERIPAFGPGLVAWMPGARPGFSGGPILDGRGRFVGMLTAIRPVSGAAAPASGGTGGLPAVEAFILRADVVRAEVRRLVAGR